MSDNEAFDYDASITESDNWSYTFDSLPKDLDGEELTYSLSEDEVSGYTASIEGSGETFTLTNTYTSETKDNPGAGGTGTDGSSGGTTGSGTTSVKIADTNNLGLWLVLLIASIAAAVTGFAMRRRPR